LACKFLRYIVDEALAGRADGLKEYVIGRVACGRGADFDPRLDPVVRVQASKLRARLSSYYESTGTVDPIRIGLPKGSYIPEFRFVKAANQENASQTGGPRKTQARNRTLIWAGTATSSVTAICVLLAKLAAPVSQQPPALQIKVPISLPAPLEYEDRATPVLSPDQRSIAVTASGAGGKSVYLLDLNALDGRPRPAGRAGFSPFFSPQGDSLAYFLAGDLMRVDPPGEARLIFRSKAGWTSPSGWSVNGEILFWDGPNSSIYAVSASGGAVREVTRPAATTRETGHRWPAALPDGEHFLYTAAFAGSSRSSVFAGSLRDPGLRRLVLDDSEGAQFVPPDRLVFIRGHRLYQQRFDTRFFRIVGEPLPVSDDVHVLPGGIPTFAVAPTVLVWRRIPEPTNTKLTWYDRLGKVEGSIGISMKINNPVLSRDGQRLLAQVGEYGERSIWVFDLANNTSRVATPIPGDHFNAAWAADGRSFFYSSNRKGIKNIYRQWLDSLTREEAILETDLDKNVESSAPDGRYLLFNQRERDNSFNLWMMPLDKSGAKPVLIGPGMGGSIGPNGRWIVYGSRGIVVTRVPGSSAGARTWRLGEGIDPQWSQDGKELFFLRGGDFMSTPVRQMGETVDFGLPRRLFTVAPGSSARNHYTFSADGGRFIFDTPLVRSRADVLMLLTNWAK
jgi:Tol biopolymer transport system component